MKTLLLKSEADTGAATKVRKIEYYFRGDCGFTVENINASNRYKSK